MRLIAMFLCCVLSGSVSADEYVRMFHKALKENTPLVLGVGFTPEVPTWCGTCYSGPVTSFDKAKDGDLVILIPFEGQMHRVWCKPEEIQSVRKSWEVTDVLDQVNAQRASRGLRPFIRDHNLTIAADRAAKFRAGRRMAGHTSSDFSFLPQRSSASAAGCAAWPASMPFGSCCLYENWTYAGASSCRGSDGLLYHHLFVR
jgi:hypothetical protein